VEQFMEEQVKAAIEEIRPSLQMDGGDIEFVGMDGDKVKVRLKGACHGCPAAGYTLALGVERHLKKRVPGIEGVIAV
jgi:Fe-S cluster biogenesis protein NfuA